MTLSVALIGGGYFAGLHVEAWHRNPDTRLAGIADLDAEKARDLAVRTTGDGGRRALFDGNRLADHPADDPRLTMGECLAEGSDGTIALDGFGRLSLRHRGGTGTRVIGEDWPRDTFGGDCVYALQRHVSDHLLHDGPVENTARAYLRNLEIEEAVYHSAASGRVVGPEGA